jgi:zinc transporter ZupT
LQATPAEKEQTMRRASSVILSVLLYAVPAVAQTPEPASDPHKFVKVVTGVAALAVGAAVAATSSQTTTTTTALGTSETSSHSTSQLVTGVAIAGVGGIVLWDGLRDHERTRPSTAIGVAAGKRAGGVFVRRAW